MRKGNCDFNFLESGLFNALRAIQARKILSSFLVSAGRPARRFGATSDERGDAVGDRVATFRDPAELLSAQE
jgi:hypothetical protein